MVGIFHPDVSFTMVRNIANVVLKALQKIAFIKKSLRYAKTTSVLIHLVGNKNNSSFFFNLAALFLGNKHCQFPKKIITFLPQSLSLCCRFFINFKVSFAFIYDEPSPSFNPRRLLKQSLTVKLFPVSIKEKSEQLDTKIPNQVLSHNFYKPILIRVLANPIEHSIDLLTTIIEFGVFLMFESAYDSFCQPQLAIVNRE
ncbi:hypothetical protein EGR_10603 [Echinococcus granulosus]|uniref:Uncharacterized protein n=1 Tax=Echinococcus granulosus TaxID=6210 RepID=W6U0A6_ECHGR|nr:hypothetical protein EGR_10603 [Echinococcus granulosus]EUB54535.1 hypothetical protein EGR_10603 [Echinococcus granulosus]